MEEKKNGRIPDWLKIALSSGLITGLIWGTSTIFASGRVGGIQEVRVSELERKQQTHEAWSQSRSTDLSSAQAKLLVFEVKIDQLTKSIDELSVELKEFRKEWLKKK